jgi:hypothetical protein
MPDSMLKLADGGIQFAGLKTQQSQIKMGRRVIQARFDGAF